MFLKNIFARIYQNQQKNEEKKEYGKEDIMTI